MRQRHLGQRAQRDALRALAAVQALAVVALADVYVEDPALVSREQAVEIARDRSFGPVAGESAFDLLAKCAASAEDECLDTRSSCLLYTSDAADE